MFKFTLVALASLSFFTACQHSMKQLAPPPIPTAPEELKGATLDTTLAPTPAPKKSEIKIGLILGPGLMRSFAHLGVLQEFHKSKIPIHFVIGHGWGALIGSFYSLKGHPYEPEWQIFKLKESDFYEESFLSAQIKARSLAPLKGVFKSYENEKLEDSKIPFACPSYNLNKKLLHWIQQGPFLDSIFKCVSNFPTLLPYQNHIAWNFNLQGSIDYLKAKGANLIVFVNVLPEKKGLEKADIKDQLLWTIAEHEVQKIQPDYVINVPTLENETYSQRRELLIQGAKAAQPLLQHIAEKIGY